MATQIPFVQWQSSILFTGVDVTANQEEISDHETFQLEAESGSGKWFIRTMQDKYFTLQAGGGVQAAEKNRSPQALFDLQWQEDGSVCFKASNGKFCKNIQSSHYGPNFLKRSKIETFGENWSEKGLNFTIKVRI